MDRQKLRAFRTDGAKPLFSRPPRVSFCISIRRGGCGSAASSRTAGARTPPSPVLAASQRPQHPSAGPWLGATSPLRQAASHARSAMPRSFQRSCRPRYGARDFNSRRL